MFFLKTFLRSHTGTLTQMVLLHYTVQQNFCLWGTSGFKKFKLSMWLWIKSLKIEVKINICLMIHPVSAKLILLLLSQLKVFKICHPHSILFVLWWQAGLAVFSSSSWGIQRCFQAGCDNLFSMVLGSVPGPLTCWTRLEKLQWM